ncbi:MAG: VOC family protein, partial [Solirubrobacteraceae bacterium]
SPDAYHLYFGDETGSPGSILTWFEFPGAPPGRAGAGMIHTLEIGVGSVDALDFWGQRLGGAGAQRRGDRLALRDPDGLGLELVVAGGHNPPLIAHHPEIDPRHALVGPQAARAYAADPGADSALLRETLGFEPLGAGEYRVAGADRRFALCYEQAPAEPGVQAAGTVHHIAWACSDTEQLEWQQRVRDAGSPVTDVRDRDYFRSIYFREPHGILFEIATQSPGFTVDEDPDHLGEHLRLPRMHEHLRAELERRLVPLENPRARWARAAG